MSKEDLRKVLLDVMDEVAPGCLPDVIDDDEDIREQMDLDSMDDYEKAWKIWINGTN